MRRRRQLSLQTQVFLLVTAVLMTAAVLVGVIVRGTVRQALLAEMGERTLSIARTVAHNATIAANLGQPGGAAIIQPVAENVRRSTGAEFVVVFDNHGVRYSHPVPERIGQHVVGGDEQRVLRGEEYTSVATGTLGTSLRGFAPVYAADKTQVGAVLVGFLTKDVDEQIRKVMSQVHLAIAAGLGISMLGSIVVADRIKATMFDLEPHEIAGMLQQRSAILASLHEGLIAVDEQGRITLINDEARRLLGASQNIIGQRVEDTVPNTRLPRVLAAGRPELSQEQVMNDVVVVTNRVPIVVDGKVVGAVSTFRDKTEVKRLAEELTGVRQYMETLRAQTHEFRNRLHRIAGYIQLGDTNAALNQITETVETHQDWLNFVETRVRPGELAALLLGKLGRARELNVSLHICDETWVDELPAQLDRDSLVVIVGNLLENAMEAVLPLPIDRRRVEVCLLSADDGLLIRVDDAGPGVPQELRPKIFQRGVTTKGEGRGIGLALVSSAVEGMLGMIELSDSALGGARFEVFIPWPEGGSA